ncbi:MAG: hypothetical protein RhofKO_37890 [Rhodothermales bacterium]
MRIFSLWIVLLGLSVTPLLAQNAPNGSIYSRFGVGELQTFGSSQAQGMGLIGAATFSNVYLNMANPGSWADQRLTRASASVNFIGISAQDGQDNTSRLGSGQLGSIQFGFPLFTQKLGVGLGYQPYSRVSHNVQQRATLQGDESVGDAEYVVNYEGSGGLQSLTGGLGYRFGPMVSVGLSYNFLFGIMEDRQRTTFNTGGFTETSLSTTTQLSGSTATLGGLFTLAQVLREGDALTLGLAYTLPTSLTGDRFNALGSDFARDTLGTVAQADVDLPSRFLYGLSYAYNTNWLFSIEGLYEPWSNFESNVSFPGYTVGGNQFFQDRTRFGLGFEYVPAPNEVFASFLEKARYRLGAYTSSSYVTPANGADVNTIAVTAGLGLPSLIPGTHLDINVEVGRRGSTDQNLVQDTFFSIGLNANVGERWFFRPKQR